MSPVEKRLSKMPKKATKEEKLAKHLDEITFDDVHQKLN